MKKEILIFIILNIFLISFVAAQNINFIGDLSGNLSIIKINNIDVKDNELNIDYSFDKSDFIGESMAVDIWIMNENKNEIKRITDVFSINKDSEIKRNVAIVIPKDSPDGIYSINIALSSDKNSFLTKSFSFNKTLEGEAFSVLEKPKNKLISYGIFLIIILLGVGFIVLSNFRKSKSKDEDYE